MNETNNQQIITFRDIWELFVQRLVIVLLITALSVAIFFVYDKATYVPMYQSTATLYIAGDDSFEGNTSADAYNTYSLALKVVNDCDYLLSSRSVVDQVIGEMNLRTAYSVLQSRISTDNPSNTRILEVTVEAESPELAKQIVDRLCEIGEEKINEVMGANYVGLYEYGTLASVACNSTPKSTYIIVAAVTAVITFGLCLLVFLLDDRIRTTENLEQVLGLTVLGDIPDSNALGQKGRYGYYRGRAYGPYGHRGYGYRAYGTYGSNTQKNNKKGKA
jgi:capsular polysaccharide biosynthesis protein